jgi:hypothetical protein
MNESSKFTRAVVAGTVGSAIYAGIIAFANFILHQNWPFSAWATLAIGLFVMGGALFLQAAQRRQIEAELSRWIGLEEATGLCEFERELDPSDEHPREKLHTIKFSLDFMGNGGSKWTKQEEQMREMLNRVGNAGQKTRMLLLNPVSDVCTSASEDLWKSAEVIPKRTLKSLQVLGRLRDDYPHLEIKTYDHPPYFRLTLLDGRAAVVGHYKQYRDDSAYSPLMIWLAETCDWSYYWAFCNYFEAEWKLGEPVTKERLKALEDGVEEL